MNEIIPGIWRWTWFSDRFGYDFSGYLVLQAGGNLCVDPVQMSDAVLDELAGRGVGRILITNRNHYRDAARLAARTGAPVAVHPADAPFVAARGVTVGEALAPGGRVGPFEVVAAEGKSPGEVALLWPERRILIVGDACVGPQAGQLGLLPDAVIDDPARLRASLGRLAALDFDTLLLCDGHPILDGGRAALAALVLRI
jgi:glyoxylase-like metal-dependent hydrolase (beta-lactamase superfamily II)